MARPSTSVSVPLSFPTMCDVRVPRLGGSTLFSVRRHNTTDVLVTIEMVPLEDPAADWRLDPGDNGRSFRATMSDQDFVGEVAARREIFRSGDTLRVRLRHRQYRSEASGRLRNDYEVKRVLAHVTSSPHDQLALDETPPGTPITDVELGGS